MDRRETRTSLLCPPAPRRQDQACRRDVRDGQDDPLRPILRLLAGPLPRSLRGCRDDQRLSWQERHLRQSDFHFLRRLCRSKRERPRMREEGCAKRQTGSIDRTVIITAEHQEGTDRASAVERLISAKSIKFTRTQP